MLQVCLATLAYSIKANPVRRQDEELAEVQAKSDQINALMEDIKELETRDMKSRQTDEALAKTEQINALMEDIKALEAKAAAKRAEPGNAALDISERDDCWPRHTWCAACWKVSIIYCLI